MSYACGTAGIQIRTRMTIERTNIWKSIGLLKVGIFVFYTVEMLKVDGRRVTRQTQWCGDVEAHMIFSAKFECPSNLFRRIVKLVVKSVKLTQWSFKITTRAAIEQEFRRQNRFGIGYFYDRSRLGFEIHWKQAVSLEKKTKLWRRKTVISSKLVTYSDLRATR